MQFEYLKLLVSGKIVKRTWPISTHLEKISLAVNDIDYHIAESKNRKDEVNSEF